MDDGTLNMSLMHQYERSWGMFIAAFPWTGGVLLDRALYLLRHTQHHVGEMWSEIKRRGHSLPDWW